MKSNQITEVLAEQKGWIRAGGQRKLVNQGGWIIHSLSAQTIHRLIDSAKRCRIQSTTY